MLDELQSLADGVDGSQGDIFLNRRHIEGLGLLVKRLGIKKGPKIIPESLGARVPCPFFCDVMRKAKQNNIDLSDKPMGLEDMGSSEEIVTEE